MQVQERSAKVNCTKMVWSLWSRQNFWCRQTDGETGGGVPKRDRDAVNMKEKTITEFDSKNFFVGWRVSKSTLIIKEFNLGKPSNTKFPFIKIYNGIFLYPGGLWQHKNGIEKVFWGMIETQWVEEFPKKIDQFSPKSWQKFYA